MPGRLTLSRSSALKVKWALESNTVALDYALVTDLNNLEEITLTKVVECLVKRYKKGHFYTFAGAVLVAINPSTSNVRKSLPADVDKFLLGYSEQGSEVENQYPSVLFVGKKCLGGLFNTGNNQVVVISGDSGAGKTTVTQQLLCYFIRESNRVYEAKTPNTLDKKIYFSTIVLESLGNASTTANHNSSRFGRFIQLQYDVFSESLVGANIRTCLLEKHRVSKFEKTERNFHIFYYVLAGIKSGTIDMTKYYEDLNGLFREDIIPTYFSAGLQETDASNLQSLTLAFQALKLKHELENVYRLIFGIMVLLGVHFLAVEDDPVSSETDAECTDFAPENEDALQVASEVFQVDLKLLYDILVSRTITVRGGCSKRQSVYRKPCASTEECDTRCYTVCTALYSFLFDYILWKLNSLFQLKSPVRQDSSSNAKIGLISLLDLYGFESLTTNSLEQLCINYANERLQRVHIQIMQSLESELRTFDEDVVPSVELFKIEAESLERLKTIHKTIFLSLDEACLLNRKVSDMDTFQRLKNLTTGNKFIQPIKTNDSNCQFLIKHYASDVKYTFAGMTHKNSDNIPDEFRKLFNSSKNPFIRSLFSTKEVNPTQETRNITQQQTGNKGSFKREQTILQRFKASVDELVTELLNNNQDTHFIKCVRPSDDTQLGNISTSVVKRQLFSSGLVDVIRISGNGYPIRILHSKFKDLFPGILIRIFQRNGMVSEEFCSREHEFRVGTKQIFLTEDGVAFLKKLEFFIQNSSVIRLQKYWKLWKKEKEWIMRTNIENVAVENPTTLQNNFLDSGGGDISIGSEPSFEEVLSSNATSQNQGDIDDVKVQSQREEEVDRANGRMKIKVETNVEVKTRSCFGEHLKYVIKKFTQEEMNWLYEKLNIRCYDGIVTRGQLFMIPVRFHIRKTVLPFSHFLPKPQGLNELLK